MSKREKVLLAVLGSIAAHLLLLFLLALLLKAKPAPTISASDEPLNVQYTEPEPTPEPPQIVTQNEPPTPPPFIQTTKRQESDHPPEKPAFQSDIDTQAASELPATGDAPLPTQEGKKSPVFAFDTQAYTPGDKPAEAATAAVATPPPPIDTTPPKPQVNRDAPRPTPAPTPVPTPPPQTTPAPDEFAELAPMPTPIPFRRVDPTPFDPFTRSAQPQPLAPGATRPAVPGFQQQTQRNQISGSIGARGPSAVAAQGTPLGRYQKAVSDAVGSRWYMYVEQHFDLPINGIVKVHFVIERSGRVRAPRVVSLTGNQTLASFSVGAIMDATIPPIPDDVLAIINANQLELDYSFYLQ